MDYDFIDSIVKITSKDKDIQSHGTGFIIHRDHKGVYILTCTHVLRKVGGNGKIDINGMAAEVLALNNLNQIDLSIVRVVDREHPLEGPVLKLHPFGKEGDQYKTACFIRSNESSFALKLIEGEIEKGDWHEHQGNSKRFDQWNLKISTDSKYALTEYSGFSGSPIVNKKNGSVLGIITKHYFSGEEHKLIAISAKAVREIIPKDVALYPAIGTFGRPPLYTMNFVGRKEKLDHVREMLLNNFSRENLGSVVVSGFGGIGKTAFGLELLRKEIEDSLLTLVHPPIWLEVGRMDVEEVMDSLSNCLPQLDITRYKDKSLKEKKIEEYFNENYCLIIFDNVWNVDVAKKLLSIFKSCAVLITTRFLLEKEILAKSLPMDRLPVNDAVELFGRLSNKIDDHQAEKLCKLFECHPLAIRILATKISNGDLEPDSLLSKLSKTNPLEVLEEEDRKVSLSLDLSFEDLKYDEKQFFTALCVFTEAGFTEEAAKEITSNENAHNLLEKMHTICLVEKNENRFRLHDLVRNYAQRKNTNDKCYERMYDYYLSVVRKAEKSKNYGLIETELSNILAGIQIASKKKNYAIVDRYLRANGLWNFLKYRGYWKECIELLGQAEAACENLKDINGKIEHLSHKSYLLHQQGKFKEAKKSVRECLKYSKDYNNRKQEAYALFLLGYIYYRVGEIPAAEKMYYDSKHIYLEINDNKGVAACLTRLGVLAQSKGKYKTAETFYKKSLEIFKEEEDFEGVVKATHHQSRLYRALGDYDKAQILSERALGQAEKLGYKEGIAYTLHQMAVLARNRNDDDDAEELYKKSIQLFNEVGFMSDFCGALRNLGDLMRKKGCYDDAREKCSESLRIAESLGYRRGILNNRQIIGELDLTEKKYDSAKKQMVSALNIARELNDIRSLARSLEYLGVVAKSQKKFRLAFFKLWQSKTIYEHIGAKKRIDGMRDKFYGIWSQLASSDISRIEKYARAQLEKWMPSLIGDSINLSLKSLLDYTYPEKWNTKWLRILLEEKNNIYMHIICSDTQDNRENTSWPHTSSNCNLYYGWQEKSIPSLWIRPRKKNPILRNRFNILHNENTLLDNNLGTISCKSLHDVCCFAALSNRMVWHNPRKGGANAPKIAHFQSIPVCWEEGEKQRYTFPCCELNNSFNFDPNNEEINSCFIGPKEEFIYYPIFGLVVEGKILTVAEKVWEIIYNYDKALACNIVIQPLYSAKSPKYIRLFVFPRSREKNNFLITEKILYDSEQKLLKNNWGGKIEEWAFAGVEMGLLTQVEWEPLFDDIKNNSKKWGHTFLRLLKELTLKETDQDWIDFKTACNSAGLFN